MSNIPNITGCGLFVLSTLCFRRLFINNVISSVRINKNYHHPFRRFSLLKDIKSSTENHKKSLVYTKTGDKGTSSLYNGERRSKTDKIFEALGNQDELGSILGVAREHCALSNNGLDSILIEIQMRIFDLGASIATPINNSNTNTKQLLRVIFSSSYTTDLEKCIDYLDNQLPPITNFVIASGGLSSTYLNYARAVCRRAERSVVVLIQEGHCDEEIGKYLNRLSDFLFVATRYAALKEGKEEILWKKGEYDNN